MALTLTTDKTTYASGDTITATYSGLTLTPGTPDVVETITGTAVVDGVTEPATVTVDIKGKPGDTVVYDAPTAAGLTFAATADATVWTALVP